MSLSPEAAAVLWQALHEAAYQTRRTGNTATGYAVLAETIDALLAPLPAAQFAVQLAAFRRPDDKQDVPF